MVESLQSSSEVSPSRTPAPNLFQTTTSPSKSRKGGWREREGGEREKEKEREAPRLTGPPAFPPSRQTDSSRAQLAEAQVQARVAAELRRLGADEDARLAQVLDKTAAATAPETTSTSRGEVAAEIRALEARLRSRGGDKLAAARETPESVERARGEVVRCLRDNDRRPLDCWREVAAFKEEVRRLEKGWVERVIS